MDQPVSRFHGTSIERHMSQTTQRNKPGIISLLGIITLLIFSSANVFAGPDDDSSSKNRPVIFNTPEGQFNGVPALEINGINLHDGANNPTVTLSGLSVTVLGMDTEGNQVIVEIPATILTGTHFLRLTYRVPNRDRNKRDEDEDEDDEDKMKSRHAVFYPYLIGNETVPAPTPKPTPVPVPVPSL